MTIHYPSVVSFDLFDTLWSRAYAHPRDVVLSAYHRYCKVTCCTLSPLMLYTLRWWCHRRLLVETAKDEVGLEEICRRMAQKYAALDPNLLLLMEEEAEGECLNVIRSMADELAIARQQGSRILFISDMHLSAGFIYGQLSRFGLLEEGDSVYISSVWGKSKRTGRLYHLIAEKESLDYKNWLHFGDDLIADHEVPRRLGIKTKYFEEGKQSRYEIIRNLIIGKNNLKLSRIKGLIRQVRLYGLDGDRMSRYGVDSVLAGVIAPLWLSYADWLFVQAKKNNWRRLFFMSRDGMIIHQIALAMKRMGKDGPECHYLYSSRNVWMMASIYSEDPFPPKWLFNSFKDETLREVSTKLGIEDEENLRQIQNELDLVSADTLLTPGLKKKLINLLQKTNWKDLVVAKASVSRDMLLEYLLQAGIKPDTCMHIGFVDIGWEMNVQSALNKILRKEWSKEVGYLYFGGRAGRCRQSASGYYRCMLKEEKLLLPVGATALFHNINLLEQVFTMHSEGTLKTYRRKDDGRIVPELREWAIEPRKTALANDCIRICTLLAESWSRLESAFERKSTVLLAVALKNFHLFCRHPAASEVSDLNRLISEDSSDQVFLPLMKPYGPRQAMNSIIKGGIVMYDKSHSDWIEGSICLSKQLPVYYKFTMRGKKMIRIVMMRTYAIKCGLIRKLGNILTS